MMSLASANDYVQPVLESLRTAERHVDSEYVDDHEETLASVSREPRYAMMPEPGIVKVITDNGGVARFYEDARASFTPGASRIIAQVATDWFVFLENVPTRLDAKTGVARTLNTATLFPKASDGIRGEFLWERAGSPGCDDAYEVPDAAGPVPHLAVRNLGIHEQALGAICRGDLEQLMPMLDPDSICAVRSYLPDAASRTMLQAAGPDEFVASIAAWLGAFELERISILNRLATEWYVFAEELLVVRSRSGPESGRRRQYRKASIYPITPAGRIQGELGYGTDIEDASPSSGQTLGAAYWERRGSNQPADRRLQRRSV